MRNIRGLIVEEVGVKDEKLNIFYGKSGDFEFVVRQPRKADSSEHRKSWKELSPYSLQRYKRKYVDPVIYDPKYRCNLPLYRGEVPGFLPLIMVVDGRIVGFADQMFKKGSEFFYHKIGEGEIGCSNALCIPDKYQGLGIGTFFAPISEYIASYFKADWILGNSPHKKGMVNIRARDGWETVGQLGGNAIIRKKLTPD